MATLPDGRYFHDSTSSPSDWLVTFLRRRWVRISVVMLGLAILGSSIWFKAVVEPELTATRFEVWIEKGDDRVSVAVDRGQNLVSMAGGSAGLTEMIVADGSMFVRAADVGVVSEHQWVKVPLSLLDGSFSVLMPDRVTHALSRRVKECQQPDEDALLLLRLLLKDQAPMEGGASLCGPFWDGAEDDVVHIIVNVEAVRPSDLLAAPDSSFVEVEATPSPESVVEELNALIAEP